MHAPLQNPQQLLHLFKALQTQTDLLLIRLVRASTDEVVVEYRSEQHVNHTPSGSDNVIRLEPAFPPMTSAPDAEWLKEAREFRYTCPILFSEGGADLMSPAKGMLALHLSSAALEKEFGASKRSTSLG